MNYEPELGQAIFGQPHKQYKCPELVEAALNHIRYELQRVMWNCKQGNDFDDPFGNNGCHPYKFDAFEVRGYDWSEKEQLFNFKWRNVLISWYKYCGRGMSSNVELTPDLINEMLKDCVGCLSKYEKENCDYFNNSK